MVGALIMPGTKRRAGFHGREDVDQAGVIAALVDNGLDSRFFAECLMPSDELDRQAGLASKLLGVFSDLIAQPLRPPGVVKQSDLVVIEVTRHRIGVTDIWKCSGDDNTVKTGKHIGDLILVALDERVHSNSSLFTLLFRIKDKPFRQFLVPAMPG